MKISLITPPSQNIEPLIPEFESKGITVIKNNASADCDFIINTSCASVGLLDILHKKFPNVPIINLVLDFYKSVWTCPNPHGYDFELYKKYMSISKELWCLSEEVVLRMKEEGIKTKCKVIRIWARLFEYQNEIIDKRYILQPMRAYKCDKNFQWLKKACIELQIPLAEPNHQFSESKLQQAIAECSFIVCEYHEASTGGLTLLEGYRLGKPVVISNSKYMGARDYFGDKAIYFDDSSYEEFKKTIKQTWDNTPKLDVTECRNHTDKFTKENMVSKMIEQMKELKNG